MHSIYPLRQRVEATVEQIFPFGVFVRLRDGTPGYIRRRELGLDPDVDPGTVVAKGDSVSAIVLNEAETGKYMELSRRLTLPDPWGEFAHRYHIRDIVQGTVTRLSTTGVFVRLVPGISGFVPLAELALWPVEKPEEMLWVGDEITATVTRLEPETKKLRLSIRAYLKNREASTALAEKLASNNEHPTSDHLPVLAESKFSDLGLAEERQRLGPVLVVDDDEKFREQLVAWLTQRGYRVLAAADMATALQLVGEQSCTAVLTDLDLLGGDGLELARQLGLRSLPLWVGLMSSPAWLAERSAEIETAGVTQVFSKPIDVEEIDAFLLRLGDASEALPRQHAKSWNESDVAPVHNPFTTEAGLPSRPDRLQATLQKLLEMTQAEKGILFSLEPDSRVVSIVAQVGSPAIKAEMFYELADSPVKDVICEMAPVLEKHISTQSEGRFRKLLDLLPFEACLGVPIEVQGQTHHAAFFFHSRPSAFTKYRLRDATAGAILLGALLELRLFDEQVRSSGALLLSGELALGLAHELYNKVSGLELMARNLLFDANRTEEQRSGLNQMSGLITDIKIVTETFQRLMNVRAQREWLDVNEIVQRANALLAPLVRKSRATVALHLAPDLPPVLGQDAWLQQAFLNLMLNALQQMTLKGGQHHLLEVRTSCQAGNPRAIQIRFTDTGPGIHKRLWEQIFTLGFTTRPEGAGLGLFLVRSLLDGMEGQVKVEESLIPFSTTFLIEVPALEATEAQ